MYILYLTYMYVPWWLSKYMYMYMYVHVHVHVCTCAGQETTCFGWLHFLIFFQALYELHLDIVSAQVSYGASTPTLSNREMFPKFYRTIPSEVQANSARFALMNRYNWQRVATLHETRNIFSLVCATYSTCCELNLQYMCST